MRRPAKIVLTLTCFLYGIGSTVCQTSARNATIEPSNFCPDDSKRGFEHAEPPSDAELDALLKTREAKEMSDRLANFDRERLRKIFRVAEIHLSDSPERDKMVLGSDPLSGADNDWFWVIRFVSGRPRVTLFANGNCLEVLKTETSGLEDIRTVWSSAAGYTLTNIYHFDGVEYRRVHAFTKTERLP
jgi:hypothetical protein